MEFRSKRLIQYLSAFCISIATLTLGASSAWTSPVIVKFNKNETDFRMSESEISWLVALNNPGFILGSLPTGYLANTFGRRTTIICSALPYLLGTIIVICGQMAWLVCLTRVLWGWGAGMVSIVVGMYIAEIADKEIRGRLSVITKFMTNLGSLIPMAIGPVISYKALNYILLGLPICYFFLCWFIPESPYFYLKKMKLGAARKELLKLRNYNDEKAIEDELTSMQSQVKNEMRRSGSPKELFGSRRYRRAIIIAVGLKIAQIMTGTGTIKQYLGPIVEGSNMDLKTSHALLIFGLVEFFTSIVSSVLADRFGRRPLLIYSFFGTGIALGVAGIYFFFQEVISSDENTLRSYAAVPFTGIILANIISALGFASIIYAIIGEIFPINVKAPAMISLNILGGFVGFLVAKLFQPIQNALGKCGVFWIYASVAITASLFALFFVPEMKGKSLKEIQRHLQGDRYEEETDKIKTGNELDDINLGECEELKTLERKDHTQV